MATNGNNLEPAFEALLKSHVQQHSTPVAEGCTQFDPDTASAYLEQALTPGELGRYEGHLAACTNCRRQLTQLAQLMPTAAPTPQSRPLMEVASLSARLRDWWASWRVGALVGLGALAATALLLVVLVNRSAEQKALIADHRPPEAATTPAASPAPTATQATEFFSAEQPAVSVKPSASTAPAITLPPQTPPAPLPAPPAVAKAEAPPPPPVPLATAPQGQSGISPRQIDDLAQLQAQERQFLRSQTEAQAERNERTRQDAAPAAAPPRPAEKVVEKENNAGARATVTERDGEKAKKSADADRKRSPEKPSESALRAAALRPTPSPVRTINGKSFQLQNGFWTDTVYDAGANLPNVRLQTDSEAYTQTLQDVPALRPYFTLAPVIVVWQNKVYRVEKK